MCEEKYKKIGSLYKSPHSGSKEPRVPDRQKIKLAGNRADFLALHQTIYLSLKPISQIEADKELSRIESIILQEHTGRDDAGELKCFEKIRELLSGNLFGPHLKIVNTRYAQFISYILRQSQLYTEEKKIHPVFGDVSSSFECERDFYAPSSSFEEPEAKKTAFSGQSNHEMKWQDNKNDIFYFLFLRVLDPWIKRELSENISEIPHCSSIKHMKKGIYAYLDAVIDHPSKISRSDALLSDYREKSEERIDDNSIRFILEPYNEKLSCIEVTYDISGDFFIVKGAGFTRLVKDVQEIHPFVKVDPETGRETRVYYYDLPFEDGKIDVTDIEAFDKAGNIIIKSREKNYSDAGLKETNEMVFNENLLRDLFIESDDDKGLKTRKHFKYDYDSRNHLYGINETLNVSSLMLHSKDDLGLGALPESDIIERICKNSLLEIEADVKWRAPLKTENLIMRSIRMKAEGLVNCFFREEYTGRDYALSSIITDSREEVRFNRTYEFDDEKRHMIISIDDNENKISFRQRICFDHENYPSSVHCVIDKSRKKDKEPGDFEKMVTHLLPGMIIFIADTHFDRASLKEKKILHYNFDKLLGDHLIKPEEIKKSSDGTIILKYNYNVSPSCSICEIRHFINIGEMMFEVFSEVKKSIQNGKFYEIRSTKRDKENNDEIIEVIGKMKDIEYQETTNINNKTVNRFVRSKRKSETVPVDFFQDPNRWLQFIPGNQPGIESFVSTYIHERICNERKHSERAILVREENYETQVCGTEIRDMLNFLAFQDDKGDTHYRTRATAIRNEYERTIIWEDGIMTEQKETPHILKKAKKTFESPLVQTQKKSKKHF